MIIAIDFDGTIVKHKYPHVGEPVPHATDVMRELINAGHKLILYTMRSGITLLEAQSYLQDNNIELYGLNTDPAQVEWTQSPKAYAHIYIDDAALGCPLIKTSARPYVDWIRVREILTEKGYL